jgi:Family of unknown function (DUF6152)
MSSKVNLIVMAVLISLSLACVPLFAHHGNASFDVTKHPTIKGVVTEFIWANPHCYLKLDAKDENGQVQHWIVEASNPPDQTRQGWAKNSFKPGDEVQITMGSVARNGQPIGRFGLGGGGSGIILNGKPFPAGAAENSGSSAPKQ